MSLSTVKDLKIVQDHQQILEAITAKDTAAASLRMREHLNRWKIDETVIRSKYPDYFK